MSPLISRDSVRFDPLYGDTRHRVPPRARHARRRVAANDTETASSARYLHQFMTAFAGGLVFFSVLIF